MINPFDKFSQGDKVYLVNTEKNKFWEGSNLGSSTQIRYGKWNKGEESKVIQGVRNYENTESALNRALGIVLDKLDKGYFVLKKENIERGRVFNNFARLIYSGPCRDDKIELEIDN